MLKLERTLYFLAVVFKEVVAFESRLGCFELFEDVAHFAFSFPEFAIAGQICSSAWDGGGKWFCSPAFAR